VLSRADTAGQAYRLWRLQRGMDADVDALPEPRQQRLGEYLARTDSDGADVLDDLDASRQQVFVDADSGLQDSLTIAHRRSDSFDANRFLRATDADSRQVLQRVDDATLRALRLGQPDRPSRFDPKHRTTGL